MEQTQIESTPFLTNKAYGLYNKNKRIIDGGYFKILEVISDEEINPTWGGGILRSLVLKIEYKRGPESEPVIIKGVDLSKSFEENDYKLFYNGEIIKGGIETPFRIDSVASTTEPLSNEGGEHRNRKSTKRVRRRRRNKTTRRRSTY